MELKTPIRFIILCLFVFALGIHDVRANDSETASCPPEGCCGNTTVSVQPGPKGGGSIPGQEICTGPSDPLEPADGYGAIAIATDSASYVSATFDRTGYASPSLGTWQFNPAVLTYSSGTNSYGARLGANSFQRYDHNVSYWKGRDDNHLSRLYVNPSGYPGKAAIYNPNGNVVVFPNPSAGPTLIERIQQPGGSYTLYQYLGSNLQYVWTWNAESGRFTHVLVYDPWGTYGPSVVNDYVANQSVTSTTFIASQWTKRSATSFIFYEGQIGYQDCSIGDLIAIDEETYLSNLTDTTLTRTVFKYYTGSTPHQLRAIIGPDSYGDFIVSESGVSSTSVFTSALGHLRGELGGYSKNYIDEEYEYYPVSAGVDALRLYKKTIRNMAGTCACSGSSNPGVFEYSYVTNNTSVPTLDTYKVQVRIDKTPGTPYVYYEYNFYGKRLVEAFVDPADTTRMRVKHWEHDSTSGLLRAIHYPSACEDFDPGNHSIIPTYTGLVYWYTYSAQNEYLTAVHFSHGINGPQKQLWGFSYGKWADGNRNRYFMTSKTQYQPDPTNHDTGPTTPVTTTYENLLFYAEDPLALKKRKTTLPAVRSASPDQNGSGSVGTEWEYFDRLGRLTWFKDSAGAVSRKEYDLYSDVVVADTKDFNTAYYAPPDGDFYQTYARSSTWPNGSTPLHHTTSYVLDNVGRVKTVYYSNGRKQYVLHTKLAKGEDVLLEFPTLNTTGNSVGALKITVSYQGGRVRDEAEATLVPTVTSSNYTTIWNPAQGTIVGALSGNAEMLSRRSHSYANGHRIKTMRYIDPETDSPVGNTYNTSFDYDDSGNLMRVQDPPDGAQAGTIIRYSYDYLDRLVSTSVGTADGTGSNMVEVERRAYDGQSELGPPSEGDGRVTRIIERVDSTPSNDRLTLYEYDFESEGRLVKTISPNSIITRNVFGISGWLLHETTYAGSEIPANLRGWRKHFYDVRGQLYETRVFAVESNGSYNEGSDYLRARFWRNQRGEIIKSQENGGVLKKWQYDALGREQRSTIGQDGSESGYSAASDLNLTGDTVISQNETLYDAGGNSIIEKTLDREPAYSGTGLLPHGSFTQARGRYIAIWYDLEDRETLRADYGHNSNTNLVSRPGTIPAASDSTRLVSKTSYTADGLIWETTDPEAIVISRSYDGLRRLVEKIENSTGTDTWSNRTTTYTYTPSDQIREITASTAGADPSAPTIQVTTYTYGVYPNQEAPGVTNLNSNRLLYQIEYPQDNGQPERERFGYNRQEETTYEKDIAGNTHKYTYTKEGELESDVVETLQSPFDGTVRSIWRTYDTVGRLETVTSRAGDSTPVNGVKVTYDKYWQVKKINQEINGAASDLSKAVTYTYNYPVQGGLPGLRLSSTSYPSGVVITEDYNSSSSDHYLSRTTGRTQFGGSTLFNNSYLGLDTVVKKNHPVPQINWEVSLDRFARVQNLTVMYIPYTYYHNSYQYGHTYNSQFAHRMEYTTSGQSEQATYNGLSMIKEFKRGVHAGGGSIPSPTYSMAWNSTLPAGPDHSGNWRVYQVLSETILPYTRTFNKSNELLSIQPPGGGNPISLSYDANGNASTYGSFQYTYDAWNRLVEVKSGPMSLLSFEYNGLGQKITTGGDFESGTAYYYTQYAQVAQEYNWDISTRVLGTPKFSYVYGTSYIDEIIARRTEGAGTWEYYMQDALYNVVSRISSSGSVINRYTYTAFGVPTQLSSSWTTSSAIVEDLKLWNGQTYHCGIGLYEYRARKYEPKIARFLERDKPGNWFDEENFGNGYPYVGNNPLSQTDSFGEMPEIPKANGYGKAEDIGRGYTLQVNRQGDCCTMMLISPDKRGTIFKGRFCCNNTADAAAQEQLLRKKYLADTLREGADAAGKVCELAGELNPVTRGLLRIAEGDITGLGIRKKKKPACFTAGTLVTTASGLKCIESIKQGDQVWSYDSTSDEWVLSTVEVTFATEYVGMLIEIDCGLTKLRVTKDHPFLTLNKTQGGKEVASWVQAGNIIPGSRLWSYQSGCTTVETVRFLLASETVYNIQTDDVNTFAVGQCGIVVHNKGSIYEVPKGYTISKTKPYIGRHNKPNPAKTRRSNDGRDRSKAKVLEYYDDKNVKEGRRLEQQYMDKAGGLEKLDNKRNEVRKTRR
jgi:RHS repeat-associated protein